MFCVKESGKKHSQTVSLPHPEDRTNGAPQLLFMNL